MKRLNTSRVRLAVLAACALAVVAGLWWLNEARTYDHLVPGATASPGTDGRAPGSVLFINGFDVRYRTLMFELERTIVMRETIEVNYGRECA